MNPVGRLAELIEDWNYRILRDGVKCALPAVGQEIAGLPYRRLRFFVLGRSLTEPFPDLQPKLALEIRPFQEADLELVREIDRPSEARLCERRLVHGYRGLIALHEHRPVGHAWASPVVDPKLERVHLKLPPGDILCADFYTTPSFRGQGVQTALTLAHFREFRNLGYRRAVCYIEVQNGPSLAVWRRKLGSLILGHIDFIRIGPWYRIHFGRNLSN